MRRWALLLFGLAACSAAPKDEPIKSGDWYDTTLDRDTSYLPMGNVKSSEVELDYGRLAVSAYLPEGNQAPVALFLPGAFCVRDRYHWLGSLLASHGVATFIIGPPDSLSRGADTTETIARLSTDAKDPASPLFDRIDLTRIVLGGHSLGAYVESAITDVSTCTPGFCAPGMKTPDGIRGLFLFGFHAQNPDDPAQPTTPMKALEVPWLIVNGTRDGLATQVKSHATFARMTDRPIALVEVLGMNHFQFTDYVDLATDRELARDNVPDVTNRAARATAAAYVVKFVRGALFGEPVADDLGAPADPRVTALVKKPRVRDDGASHLPRAVFEPIGQAGFNGSAGNNDVVATAAYGDATYMLVRNDTAGATLWRVRAGKIEPLPFPGQKASLNCLFGAMAVFHDKLYIGLSSGNQGGFRASTGAEVWAYDGQAFTQIVGSDVDQDFSTRVVSCAAEGKDVRVTVATVLEPGAWTGAMLQSGDLSLDIQSNDTTSLVVRQNESVSAVTSCDQVMPDSEWILRKGLDEAGFGNLWNKAIMAMAVHDDKLYVATGLNYMFGGALYRTTDGSHFETVLDPAFFGFQMSGTPKSSSVNVLYSSRGSLYVAATGTENYGARLLALKNDVPRWIVDDGAPIANGFGRGTFQIASIVEQGDRLWLGGFDFLGAELFSLDGAERLTVHVGEGAAVPRGFGDTKQIALNLASARGLLWIGTYAYVSNVSDFDELSALVLRSSAGDSWQYASTHAFGVNAVGVTRLFEQDGVLYGVASRGSLTGRNDLGPLRLYVVRDEAPPSVN